MKNYTPKQLKKILNNHSLWLACKKGARADLTAADLTYANLSNADLSNAILTYANLSNVVLNRADLRGANLSNVVLNRADLRGADLRGANLTGADLINVDLRGAILTGADFTVSTLINADLTGADLTGAILTGAILTGADLRAAELPAFQIPQEGTLVVYKKLHGCVVKLLIPAEAKRTASLVGRKCRASEAIVLEFLDVVANFAIDGEQLTFRSLYDPTFKYVVGQTVKPAGAEYDGDIRIECAPGIHFFLTREEAEDYT